MLQLLDAKGIGLGSARVFTYQVVSGQHVCVTFVLDKFPTCFYHNFLEYVSLRFRVHNKNHCFLSLNSKPNRNGGIQLLKDKFARGLVEIPAHSRRTNFHH
jgi:hypothetical protein